MKKIVFAFTLLCFSTILLAQTTYPIVKGSWLAGGKTKLAFSSEPYIGDEKIKTTSFRFSPNIGHFIADQWAIGGKLDFETSSTKFGNMDPEKYNDMGLGIFTRYYFLEATQRTNFFGEAGFSIGSYKYDDDEERNGYNNFNLALAMALFLNRNVAIEIGFDYSSFKYEDEDDRSSRFGLCAGFQAYLDPCSKSKARLREASVTAY